MDTVKSPTLREVRALGTLLRVFIATMCVGFAGGIVSLFLNWLFVTIPGLFGTPGQLNLIERLMAGIFSGLAEVCVYSILAIGVSIGIYWLVSLVQRMPLAPTTYPYGSDDADVLPQEAEP